MPKNYLAVVHVYVEAYDLVEASKQTEKYINAVSSKKEENNIEEVTIMEVYETEGEE